MKFTKMQGLGNDYLYVFAAALPPHVKALSKQLSDRHFGAGADGMIFILPSDRADFMMRIFNADGSEAKMCGNGIRCVGKYVYDKGYTDKTRLTVETPAGIKTLLLHTAGGKVQTVTVDMGRVAVGAPQTVTATESTVRLTPVNMGKVTVCEPVTLTVCGQALTTTPVSVGNPHTVTFIPDAENAPLTTVGAALEHDAFFPEGVNAEFAQVLGENDLRMRVWERGSGITMACGTGACATAAAAVKAGYCKIDEDISVRLDGGTLHIRVLPDYTVMMTGPAATVCECEVDE